MDFGWVATQDKPHGSQRPGVLPHAQQDSLPALCGQTRGAHASDEDNAGLKQDRLGSSLHPSPRAVCRLHLQVRAVDERTR